MLWTDGCHHLISKLHNSRIDRHKTPLFQVKVQEFEAGTVSSTLTATPVNADTDVTCQVTPKDGDPFTKDGQILMFG